MRDLFHEIKKAVWPDRHHDPEIRRIKFNHRFKHVSIWSAEIDDSLSGELLKSFEGFVRSETYARLLEDIQVTFTKLTCVDRGRKKYVQLQLHKRSQESLRLLQSHVIEHFVQFRSPDTVGDDFHCTLLYLDTKFPLRQIGDIIDNIQKDPQGSSAAIRKLQSPLTPFVLSHRKRFLGVYPEPYPRLLGDFGLDDFPEWVPRSVCLMNFPDCSEEEAKENFRKIAELCSYEDLEDHMFECRWEVKFYEKERIVVEFRDERRRDDFYRHFMMFIAIEDYKVFASHVNPDYPKDLRVGVYKALPRSLDSLHFYAEDLCFKELRNRYRSKVDLTTWTTYLQQIHWPYWQYNFDASDVDSLVDLLKRGDPTEYISSDCWGENDPFKSRFKK